MDCSLHEIHSGRRNLPKERSDRAMTQDSTNISEQDRAEEYFSSNYAEARSRFVETAKRAGSSLLSYSLDEDAYPGLSIDVATIGCSNTPTLLISSGVHGVEGYAGSAIQLALLEQLPANHNFRNLRTVLIHAVNPYGFAHGRRVNEENIDLNRNFHASTDDYFGAPATYSRLDRFLNPTTPPQAFDLFYPQSLITMARYGLPALRQAVAGGQYAYPRGLFFGGKEPSRSARIIRNHAKAWLSGSDGILHLDLHTGLGSWGAAKLLLEPEESRHATWYNETFGDEVIVPSGESRRSAYDATGLFGPWMQQKFGKHHYRFATLEFGTYPVLRVLRALRAENRAHHYSGPGNGYHAKTRAELLECFSPVSPAWRKRVVQTGIQLIERGCRAMSGRDRKE